MAGLKWSVFITFSSVEFQCSVWDLERPSGFKYALEAGQDSGPPLGDAFQKPAALHEALMCERQLDKLAIWLKYERRERREFVSIPVRLIHERIGQPPRRIAFDDLAGIGDGAIASHHLE